MATPRKISDSGMYHAIARGTGRQIIFEDDNDRRRFLQLLERALEKTDSELFAWCLMDNHFHLLVRAESEALSSCMRLLCGQYAGWFNRRSGREGHLFHERFRSETVETDEYLLTVVRYIHANPQNAGVCPLESYPWSSFREYLGEPWLCNTGYVIDIFGGLEQFVAFHRELPDQSSCLDAEAPRSKTRAIRDADALPVAQRIVGEMSLDAIKALPRALRDERLRSLKSAGLTIRQIERLTGIGRGTVARA